MTTRREYLVSLGLALPNTRGKFSNDGKQALIDAREKGMTFDDDVKPEPKRKAAVANVSDATAEGSEDAAKVAKVTPQNQWAPHRRNWTDAKYLMFAEPAGKTWFKAPCTECGYSVANCRCGETHVWDLGGRVKCALVGPIH